MNAGTNAKAGKSVFVVAEADESDGSFLEYRPVLAVVTNIEPDHLEHFDGNFDNLKQAYVQFLGHLKPEGKAILCVDDAHVREMMPTVGRQVLSYSIDPDYANLADFTARNIVESDRKNDAETVWRKSSAAGRVEDVY